MRQIGTVATDEEARRLADYLLTLNITSRIDQAKDGYAVWVHREEQVEQAKREFQEFVQNPLDAKYQGKEQAARALRKKAEQQEKDHARNTINMRGRRNYRPLWRCPLTYSLIAACVGISLATGFGHQFPAFVSKLYISDVVVIPNPALSGGVEPAGEGRVFETEGDVAFRNTGYRSERRGEVWRLVTPMLLHFDLLHLLFNMFWLFDLAGMIEMRKGWWWLAILVLVLAVASNVGQFEYSHNPMFGGMSGVVYGLFGYVWMKGHYEPTGTLTLRQGTINMMMLWLVLCIAEVIPNVANAAHVAGLATGMLIGFVPHLADELRRW